jgi:hypothetical protein
MDNTHATKVSLLATAGVMRQLQRGQVPWDAPMPAELCRSKEARMERTAYHTPLAACRALASRLPGLTVLWREAGSGEYSPVTDAIVAGFGRHTARNRVWCRPFLHDLVHAAFHPSRLAIPTLTTCQPFTVSDLTAELGAAYLAGATGLPAAVGHVAPYCQCWLDALRADPHLLPAAVDAAAVAVTYLLTR